MIGGRQSIIGDGYRMRRAAGTESGSGIDYWLIDWQYAGSRMKAFSGSVIRMNSII